MRNCIEGLQIQKVEKQWSRKSKETGLEIDKSTCTAEDFNKYLVCQQTRKEVNPQKGSTTCLDNGTWSIFILHATQQQQSVQRTNTKWIPSSAIGLFQLSMVPDWRLEKYNHTKQRKVKLCRVYSPAAL